MSRPNDPAPAVDDITGLVLAGGRGSRMGHVDKGLQLFRGYPMVMHVLMRLAPQVGPMLVNANQNLAVYEALGYPVVADQIANFAGPLAGLHAGLGAVDTPFLLCVPCDTPFLPGDLARRLAHGITENRADVAVARTGEQAHPVFCLMRRDLREHLAAYLTGGGRKIDAWYASLHVAEVRFDDNPDAFANINTQDELRRLEDAPGT